MTRDYHGNEIDQASLAADAHKSEPDFSDLKVRMPDLFGERPPRLLTAYRLAVADLHERIYANPRQPHTRAMITRSTFESAAREHYESFKKQREKESRPLDESSIDQLVDVVDATFPALTQFARTVENADEFSRRLQAGKYSPLVSHLLSNPQTIRFY
jgi:hypothetical protein